MLTTRKKQQIACDGVRNEWLKDPFTEILHKQVVATFSIDGVIPPLGTPKKVVEKQKQVTDMKYEKNFERVHGGEFRKFVKAMDGIRAPWKSAPKTA